MDAPSQQELDALAVAQRQTYAEADLVVHWQSAFGFIIIETRGGQVFVNGERVRPANFATEEGDK